MKQSWKKLQMSGTVVNDAQYKLSDLVFYQDMNEKACLGPENVFCHRGRNV